MMCVIYVVLYNKILKYRYEIANIHLSIYIQCVLGMHFSLDITH